MSELVRNRITTPNEESWAAVTHILAVAGISTMSHSKPQLAHIVGRMTPKQVVAIEKAGGVVIPF